MNAKFHHAGLVVPDLAEASLFYSQFLSLKEVMRFQWDQSDNDTVAQVINLEDSAAKVIMLEGDNYRIELFEYTAPSQKGDPANNLPCDLGITHIAFEFDDIHEACEKFTAAGGTLHRGPIKLGTTWAIYGRDPFGNIIELMQPVPGIS